MIELNADGTKKWGPKLYGNYPGGVNQFTGLGIGNWALIYNECWGITTTFDPVTNGITGYAFACGTGIENCNNEGAATGGGFNSTTQTECNGDPRVQWRALTIAVDLQGNRLWSRQDSFQGGTKASHATV